MSPQPHRKKKHLHTFQLKKGHKPTAGLDSKIFRCIDPECWFYSKAAMLVGKRAQCPKCLGEFVLTSKNLKLKNPHCDACSTGVKAQEKMREANEIAESVMKLLDLK